MSQLQHFSYQTIFIVIALTMLYFYYVPIKTSGLSIAGQVVCSGRSGMLFHATIRHSRSLASALWR
jgi:hypothetical protein